jgi:uncharacterized protein YndB with AHSA1/START domain
VKIKTCSFKERLHPKRRGSFLSFQRQMTQQISKTIIIQAPPHIVWGTLTKPSLMRQWMAEPEMELEISTNWNSGSAIVTKGFHHVKFESKGIVLQVEPDRVLRYNYLSSLSRLPDNPDNYTIIDFKLEPLGDQTSLTLTLSNFPTEAIFKHVDFYWETTLRIMKTFIEKISTI